MRLGRENFYLVFTDYSSEDEENGQAHGYLLGDYQYRGLERDIVAHFLEAIDKKRVLFAGSNLQGCIDTTLGYFRYVNAQVSVLLNYCGLDIDTSTNLAGTEEYNLNGQKFSEYAKNHPQIESIMERITNLFEQSLIDIKTRTEDNLFYETSQDSRIIPCNKYVSELS